MKDKKPRHFHNRWKDAGDGPGWAAHKPPWTWHRPGPHPPWQQHDDLDQNQGFDHGHDCPWPGGAHGHHPPPWEHKRGFVFLRFAAIFGVMTLLAVGSVAALAFLFTRLLGGNSQTAILAWIGGCSLSLTLPLLVIVLAVRAFRDIAAPLSDLMKASDTVAEGDLSVRVPVRGNDEFARLAESFNHMTEELEQADQRRRNLTADVAHELRNPLHVIQGNLEGILDDVYQPTEEHINATLAETRQLARLVEDLRTLSLAEAGQLPLHIETVNICDLLADVGTSFGSLAEAAGIDLRVEVNGLPPELTIVGDVGRLDQVLSNLVGNSLRHTMPGGTVDLRAGPLSRPESGGSDPCGVRIIVEDTGEGIPAEDLPFIFDRFWRADRARSHADGAGSGLGLAIARYLVQAHGGQISVESQLGQGTRFCIDLPQAKQPASDD